MPGQETCAPPVIVTFPAQINAATAEQAAGQISAAFTPGVTVVIADLTATACRDCSAIRYLLRAHRQAAVRGGQVHGSDPVRRLVEACSPAGKNEPLLARVVACPVRRTPTVHYEPVLGSDPVRRELEGCSPAGKD